MIAGRALRCAASIRIAKRKKAIEGYIKWRKALRPAAIHNSACDLREGSESTVVTKYFTRTVWTCARCGNNKTAQDAKRYACTKRTTKIQPAQFREASMTRKACASWKKTVKAASKKRYYKLKKEAWDKHGCCPWKLQKDARMQKQKASLQKD